MQSGQTCNSDRVNKTGSSRHSMGTYRRSTSLELAQALWPDDINPGPFNTKLKMSRSVTRLVPRRPEDDPARDAKKGVLARNLDIRYMKNLLNFTDCLRPPYCNQQQCPTMKQRLNRHMHDHHHYSSNMQHHAVVQTSNLPIKMQDQAVSVLSKSAGSRIPTFISQQTNDIHSVQTELTSADLSRLDYIQKYFNLVSNPENNTATFSNPDSDIKQSLPISATRSVIPEKSFYKEHLKDFTANWLRSIPNATGIDKELQENIVNELTEKIYHLAVDANNKDYEHKIKFEIDDCLKKLLIIDATTHGQIILDTEIRNNLLKTIKKLNKKYLINLDTEIDAYDLNNTMENRHCLPKYESFENSNKVECLNLYDNYYGKEILHWLNTNMDDKNISNIEIAILILKEFTELINENLYNPKYKLMLKGRIFKVLDGLNLLLKPSKNRYLYLNKCADELASRLLIMRIKTENKNYLNENIEQNLLTNRIEKVKDCLGVFKMTKLVDIEEEISSTIMSDIDSSTHINDNIRFNENSHNSQQIREDSNYSSSITKSDTDTLKNVEIDTTNVNLADIKTQISGVISVYTSKEYSYVATSTPKKIVKKDIPKLNSEELAYMDKVADLIRTWMDKLPKQYNDDKNYKETIIYDLAGDIMDEGKLKQLSSDIKTDSDKYLKYITYRWLCRFNFFDNMKDSRPLVNDFLNKLNNIPVPILTKPQHGNRQTMKNVKHAQSEMRNEDFIPQGIDVLEDQISVWMNEQPSEIYVKKDKAVRLKLIHNLALTLQDRLRNKSSDSDVIQDIDQWLRNVLKPKEIEHIGILTEALKEKIVNTPQDETLEGKVYKKKRERIEYLEARKQPQLNNSTNVEIKEEFDKTMQDFIIKYIEYNYEIDDPLARGAFGHLLKTELRKLNPLTRKEVYDNISKESPHEKFSPFKLSKELEYIKIISDWLNNIPIVASYNTLANKKRIDFVNDLAKNIAEAEAQRSEDPSKMDYDLFIASIIKQSIRNYEIPVLPEHEKNENLIVDQLMNKIVAIRDSFASQCCSLNDTSISDNTSNINEQNIGDFIEHYMRLNGRDIADDKMKLEAWSARLLKEIKKMIHISENTNALSKAQVYNRFADVPIPDDESVKLFVLELEYVKEISEWLKNLPLLPVDKQPQAQKERIEMIADLAEKMTERATKKAVNPEDMNIDIDTANFVYDWISKLPVHSKQNIVMPLATQQLINRIDRVSKRSHPAEASTSQTSISIKNKNKSAKSPKEHKCTINVNKCLKDPGKIIVDAIDHFYNKLPIHGDKETVKSLKDYMAKKLYQIIGEFNVNPKIFNNDLLYHEMLEDEIDTQLENIPQSSDLQNQREDLKIRLIDTILEAKKLAKSNAAGEDYKHKLETTIDISIPNPIHRKEDTNPGFEIYKNHLANMFILENYDHGNDEIKAKYENNIKDEIHKYSKDAQNENALPITEDRLYNELYSTLFKVPTPSVNAVTDKVEEVKTRCELQTWFEELPLQDPSGSNDLLERDKILSTLAKRIHDIEKEPKCDEKLCKEIKKWLVKLPFISGQENNIDEFVTKLQNTLKLTASARKCTTEANTRETSKFKTRKGKGILGTSQVAGPSSAGQNWVSPPCSPDKTPCCIKMSYQKPGDKIIEIVEEWCKQIPLVLSPHENQSIKDNLTTSIIMKISELNINPEIFDYDIIYSELLDEELNKLLSGLPTHCSFQQSIPARKYQLIEKLKSIKPLIKDEKLKHEYKEELKNTVHSILEEPLNTTKEKLEMFNDLRDDIVDNYIQYNYNGNDEEMRNVYKKQVHDAVVKYFLNIRDKGTEEKDPLIVRNQLLCELGKIPIPCIGALQDTVEEIKMKAEVEEFFENLPASKGDPHKDLLCKQLKISLSKRLNDLEKSGHNCSNDRKMQSEITRCLKKLDIDVKPNVIEAFVNKLKSNEDSRRISPNSRNVSLFTNPRETEQRTYKDFHSGVTMSSSLSPQVQDDQLQQLPSSRTKDQSGSNLYFGQSKIDYKDNNRSGKPRNSIKSSTECPMLGQSPIVSQSSRNQAKTPEQHDINSIPFITVPHSTEENPSFPLQAPNPQFYDTNQHRPSIDKEFSPTKKRDRSLGESEINYDDFSGRIIIKSSLGTQPQQNTREGNISRITQGIPNSSAPRNNEQDRTSDITPSSLFDVPHISQIGNSSRFDPRNHLLSNERYSMPLEQDRIANVESNEGVCNCVKRVLKNCKGRPQCEVELDEYCDECGGFGPMWWRVTPGFLFY